MTSEIQDAGAPPTVTFLVLAYRQEALVRQACEAALAQDLPGLEVILSDDASPDGTFEVMSEVARRYAGPHRVVLNRNERNLGLISHLNHVMTLATGELVVGAAGDDVSRPDRARRLLEAYLASGRRALSIHSAVEDMDFEGRTLSVRRPRFRAERPALEAIATKDALVIGATHAWSRRLYDVFGPLAFPRAYEDLVLAFRAALLGELAYVDEPLVRYRLGQGISTSPRHGFLTLAEARATLLRRSAVRFDVLRQREADCRCVGRDPPGRLRRARQAEEARVALFSGRPAAAAGLVLRHPGGIGLLLGSLVKWASYAARVPWNRLKARRARPR